MYTITVLEEGFVSNCETTESNRLSHTVYVCAKVLGFRNNNAHCTLIAYAIEW